MIWHICTIVRTLKGEDRDSPKEQLAKKFNDRLRVFRRVFEKDISKPSSEMAGSFVFLPTTRSLDADEITRLHLSGFVVLGLVKEKVKVDGLEQDPVQFLLHDFSHGDAYIAHVRSWYAVARSREEVKEILEKIAKQGLVVLGRIKLIKDPALRLQIQLMASVLGHKYHEINAISLKSICHTILQKSEIAPADWTCDLKKNLMLLF